MAVAQRWQYIPSAVASQAEQQDRAQQWGDSQRQALAQVWADNQRAQSAGLLNQYLPPSADPGLPPDYGTGTDVSGRPEAVNAPPLAPPSRMGGDFTPDSGLTLDEAAGISTPPEAPQGLLGDKGFVGADVTKLAPTFPETSASSADPFAPLRPAFDFLKSIPIFGPGQLPELPRPGEPLQDVLASNTNTAIQNASQSPRPMVGPFGGLGINSPAIDPNLLGDFGGAAGKTIGSEVGKVRQAAQQVNATDGFLARLALGGANVPSRVASTVVPGTVSWLNSVLAPVRNAAPEVQRAIAAFANHRLQAAVDAETLGLRAANLLGKENKATAASLYERTGQFLPNPTTEQADFAKEWEDFAQHSLDLGHQGGYISGTAQNLPGVAYYFPHVFAENTAPVAPRAARSSLSPRDFFSNPRDFPTLEEAIAAGKTPVDTVSGPVRYYVQHVMNSEAKVQLVTDLKAASPAAIMPYQRGDRLPPGWVPGRALDPVLGGYAFPRPVADVIDNITQPSGLAGPVLRAMATAKETLFSLSGFHLVTELRQAYRSSGFQGIPAIGRSVWNAAVPGAYDTFRLRNADAFSQASSAGVTGLSGEYGPDIGQRLGGGKGLAATAVRAVTGGTAAGGSAYFNAKATGADEETALQRAAIYGVAGAVAGPTVGKALSDALWERAVPTLKVLTFQLAKQKASPEAAATFVNQTFGGNNLAAIGRSKTVQDAIRLAVLAPDWWEGWARQLKGVLPGQSTGRLSRAYWARTIAVDGAFMLEGLNLALGGHLTDQNEDGHQFDLELTGLYDRMGWNHTDPKTGQPFRVYSDILGPIRSILEGPGDPGQFLKSHAGIVPGVTADLMSNRDFRGNPIVPPGTPAPVGAAQTVAHAAARIAPVGAQSLEQSVRKGEPAPVAAAAAITGFRTSDVSPRQEIGKARAETAAQYRPPGLQKLLQSVGMQSVSPVEPYITIGRDRLPLQLDEWKQYQGEFQKRFEPYVQRFTSDDRFAGLPQDDQKNLIEAASRKAREAASETVLKTLDPADVRRRIVAYRNRGTP